MACAAFALALAGCAPGHPRPRPLLDGPAQRADAADPSQGRWTGWGRIDDAVRAGAIEHMVVAWPAETVSGFRIYRLHGPQGQPGELMVERSDAGLSLTIRLGRFGMPELEGAVLDEVTERLKAAGR